MSTHKIRLLVAAWGACLLAVVAAVILFLTVGDRGAQTAVRYPSQSTDEQAQLLNALRDKGLLPSEDASSSTDGKVQAATQDHRDRGAGPTFTQIASLADDQLFNLFPAGSMTAADVPTFKSQIMQLRQFVTTVNTPEKAKAAGYFQATNDVPYMGEHWINGGYLQDGLFDPGRPEGLLFSTVGGVHQLVGVWFLELPGMAGATADTPPQGFAGNFAVWHAHSGLCLVGTDEANEGVTREGCAAKGGDYTADFRWMLHVWVAPEAAENSRSVVAYLNAELNQKQEAEKATAFRP